MSSIDVERIRQYNSKCNEYKNRVSQLQAERKILTENIKNMCAQLSTQLGIEVTPENIEQIYEERAKSIQYILETGEGIIKKIQDSESGVSGTGTEGVRQSIPGASVGASMGAGASIPSMSEAGFGSTVGFAEPSSNNDGTSLPKSDYKIPSGFGGQAFGSQGASGKSVFAQSAFRGGFSSIKIADPEDDVTEI